MTQPTKKTPQTGKGAAPPQRMTKRALTRRERERARQRRAIIIIGSMIGLALLAVIGGVLYDQVWVPSRPVAQVNATALSRGGYWQERRNELARSIAQNLQFQRLFGSQFGQLGGQIRNQISTAEGQVRGIRQAEIDQPTINGWIEREVITQGAARLNFQASDAEIAQRLVTELGQSFAPPITPTATISPTTAPTVAAEPTATTGPTATPGGPTATPPPTATEAPTATPIPTPLAEVAVGKQDAVLQELFNAYTQELSAIDPQQRPGLTIDDFRAGLHDQYLRQVLTEKVQTQLVPEAGFTLSTDPSGIETRHILIKNTELLTATEAVREAEYTRRRPEAEAILAQLRGGADFATLAREKSEDLTTRESGGTLPAFDKTGKTQSNQQFDPAFVTAVLALQDGQISDLVKTPFGWHIIQRVKTNVPSKEEQLREARTKAFDAWLVTERQGAGVQRFPAATDTPTPAPTPIGTVEPLPTAPLGGEPTPLPTATLVPTGTVSLPAPTGVPTGTVSLPAPTAPAATP